MFPDLFQARYSFIHTMSFKVMNLTQGRELWVYQP